MDAAFCFRNTTFGRVWLLTAIARKSRVPQPFARQRMSHEQSPKRSFRGTRPPMIRILLALVGFVWTTAALAQNFVTVNPEPAGLAWWLRADFHALHREVRGIPVANIRPDWCKATEFSRPLFPPGLLVEQGSDLLAEAGLSFSIEGAFDGSGKKQIALVGVYETCRGQKGRFFLILDADTRKVRFLDAQATTQRFSAIAAQGRSTIVIMYCLECDVASSVRWDRARKRFVAR
jgi:hypothetical protein